MHKILLANDFEGLKRLAPILHGTERISVSTMNKALEMLELQKFDLIVAGVHFDDSRAVELFKFAKEQGQNKLTPFLFIRTRASTISDQLRTNIESLEKFMDHCGYIETEFLDENKEQIRVAILAAISCASKSNKCLQRFGVGSIFPRRLYRSRLVSRRYEVEGRTWARIARSKARLLACRGQNTKSAT